MENRIRTDSYPTHMRRQPSTIGEHGVSAGQTDEMNVVCSLPLPLCYHTACDTNGRGLMPERDLCNVVFGDQTDGLDVLDAAQCVDLIGAFHARWWERKEILKPGFVEHRYMMLNSFDEYWPFFRKQHNLHLSSDQLRQGDALYRHVPDVLKILEHRPATLIHADLRADNFRIDRLTGEVYLLDWQLLSLGIGAFDLCRLIGGNLKQQINTEGHRILYYRWHHALISHGVENYSIEDADIDYRLAMLISLNIPVSNYCLVSSFGDHNEHLAQLLTHRFFEGAATIDAASVLG